MSLCFNRPASVSNSVIGFAVLYIAFCLWIALDQTDAKIVSDAAAEGGSVNPEGGSVKLE